MMANKDAGAFLANFAGLTRAHHGGADSWLAATRCRRTDWRTLRARSACASKTRQASEVALQTLSRLAYEVPPRILIAGSLYLAGHVLAAQRHAALP